MVFVFAVMGFAALVASCGPSGSKVAQKIGSATAKKAPRNLKSAGSSNMFMKAGDDALRIYDEYDD